jgi:hypothetical protein
LTSPCAAEIRHPVLIADDDDTPYRIEFRWKEQVIYWENGQGFVFEGGWGVSPPVTYVPDKATWDGAVPDWMRGRRDEIVERLIAYPNHVVEETTSGYWTTVTE